MRVMCRQTESYLRGNQQITQAQGKKSRSVQTLRKHARLAGAGTWGLPRALPHHHRCGGRCIVVSLGKVLLQGKPSASQT